MITKTKKSINPEIKSVEEVLGDSEALKIWMEIKDKPIAMFALPNQAVSQYCVPQVVEPTKLYLLTTATAVLPALEAALSGAYVVELVHKFVVVSRPSNLLGK